MRATISYRKAPSVVKIQGANPLTESSRSILQEEVHR
jgi:hypothetical protein